MEDLQVFSVQKIQRGSNGEFTYMVVIGFETVTIERMAEGGKVAQIKLDIPGIPTRVPGVPVENKVVLFMNEEEWKNCSKKFIVGDAVSITLQKNGSINIG